MALAALRSESVSMLDDNLLLVSIIIGSSIDRLIKINRLPLPMDFDQPLLLKQFLFGTVFLLALVIWSLLGRIAWPSWPIRCFFIWSREVRSKYFLFHKAVLRRLGDLLLRTWKCFVLVAFIFVVALRRLEVLQFDRALITSFVQPGLLFDVHVCDCIGVLRNLAVGNRFLRRCVSSYEDLARFACELTCVCYFFDRWLVDLTRNRVFEARLLIKRIWRVETPWTVVRALNISVDATDLHLGGRTWLFDVILFALSILRGLGPLVIPMLCGNVDCDITTRDAVCFLGFLLIWLGWSLLLVSNRLEVLSFNLNFLFLQERGLNNLASGSSRLGSTFWPPWRLLVGAPVRELLLVCRELNFNLAWVWLPNLHHCLALSWSFRMNLKLNLASWVSLLHMLRLDQWVRVALVGLVMTDSLLFRRIVAHRLPVRTFLGRFFWAQGVVQAMYRLSFSNVLLVVNFIFFWKKGFDIFWRVCDHVEWRRRILLLELRLLDVLVHPRLVEPLLLYFPSWLLRGSCALVVLVWELVLVIARVMGWG